jgi:galactokinase
MPKEDRMASAFTLRCAFCGGASRLCGHKHLLQSVRGAVELAQPQSEMLHLGCARRIQHLLTEPERTVEALIADEQREGGDLRGSRTAPRLRVHGEQGGEP